MSEPIRSTHLLVFPANKSVCFVCEIIDTATDNAYDHFIWRLKDDPSAKVIYLFGAIQKQKETIKRFEEVYFTNKYIWIFANILGIEEIEGLPVDSRFISTV